MTDFFDAHVALDASAKDGEPKVVSNPKTGDVAQAQWTGDMWALNVPDATVQLDFEPTHYLPRNGQ